MADTPAPWMPAVLHSIRGPARAGFQAVFGGKPHPDADRCPHGRVDLFEECRECQAAWHRGMVEAHEKAIAGHRAALARLAAEGAEAPDR